MTNATATDSIIEVRGLTKVFRDFWGRPRVKAIDGIDLEIKRGETFGLLGPNGSGKTTTIKCLLGLLWPSSGEISVLGKPPVDVATKRKIGFLPEETYLYRFLSAFETVDFYLRLHRWPRRQRRRRALELLERVGLSHAANRKVGEFSKGMARRVALAGALSSDPELLILDEPTSGLDPLGTRQMKDLIRDASERGTTVLVSSHILFDVQETCDRVAILRTGKVALTGRVDELLKQGDVTQIEFSTPPRKEDLDRVISAVAGAGVEVLGVENPRYTLEALFLDVIARGERP